MRILIVEPRQHNSRYDTRSLTPGGGAVVVATLLERAGHKVEVVSEYVTRFDPEEANTADLVGISLTTYNARRGYEIAQRVRRPVVFGGFHPSLVPEECLRHGSYVIRGDGFPVVQLAERLAADAGREPQLDDIPNLVYRRDGGIVHNPRESRVADVVPNHGLVRDYYRFGVMRLLRYPLLASGSRGCPGRCGFCAIAEVFPEVRCKSVGTLLADIRAQVSRQPRVTRLLPRCLWITDDNFFADRAWAKTVLRGLARFDSGHQLVVQARTEIGRDEELLRLMKEARISRVYLGIESLDQEGLDDLGKAQPADQSIDTIRKLQRLGIEVHGLFVFGGDTFRKGDGRRVADFVQRNELSGVLIQPLTPFPGTRLYRTMQAEGRILSDDWSNYGGRVVFQPQNLTPAELQFEIETTYRAVYSLPRIVRYFFAGKRGFRIQIAGEALFRRLEMRKLRRYARERLES